jgi:hypothetical protein
MAPGGTSEALSRDAIRVCTGGAYRGAMWDAAVVLSADRRLTNTTCSRGAVLKFLPLSLAHSHSRVRLSVLASGRLMWLLLTGCRPAQQLSILSRRRTQAFSAKSAQAAIVRQA